MEMTAVVCALEACDERGIADVRILTDSTYVKNGITTWIKGWKRKGWKTATGSPVKNKELWIRMETAKDKINNVEWCWVKAHNGNPQNEAVDELARTCAKNVRDK